MRILIQRVSSAQVTVQQTVVGSIGRGLLVFLGIAPQDTPREVDWLTAKLSKLRLFSDHQGLMNLSVNEIEGQILLVSQFTLYVDATLGNRPSFTGAARPEVAEPLYQLFIQKLSVLLKSPIAAGQFGADMQVTLTNDGPVTLFLERDFSTGH